MMAMPFQILGVWLRGLLALALLGAGFGLLASWYNHREQVVQEPADAPRPADRADGPAVPPDARPVRTRVVSWEFGPNRETAFLLGGLALVAWSLGGGLLAGNLFRGTPRGTGGDDPVVRPDGEVRRLRRPDGSELHVELFGPADGPPLVLTHGWGLDADEWCYARGELARRYRLIAWDLPGLGRSSRAADNNWDLEKLAGDLDAVVGLAGGRPAILLGHSIGGMILLTYCRVFPDALGRRVRGLVIAHSTYTNPVRTTRHAALYAALQRPLLEPLCHLTAWLAPLAWAMNWLSYFNGSMQRSTDRGSFSGHESRAQLDFVSRRYAGAWPGVVARGMLAMLRYDATATLATIPVPTLVVTGDQDPTCVPEASAVMTREIPGARLVTLAPAKHCGLFEHHTRFHEAVDAFLAGLPEPAVVPAPGRGEAAARG